MNKHSQGTTGIEVLEKILRPLKITEKYALDKNRTTEPATLEKMLIASIPTAYNEIAQAVILKNIALNLGQFDNNQTKFEDQWKRI